MQTLKRFACAILFIVAGSAHAALVTDPSDPRSWQGATVGTFAGLFGLTNQQVIDNQLLDDGIFDISTGINASLIQCLGCGSPGKSLDTTGTGSYAWTRPGGTNAAAGSAVDDLWVQTGAGIGNAVWDLGAAAPKAAIFNTIDHGPLPGEAIESTVYLSNDRTNWFQAVTERVWLEGFMPNLGILWDGFAYSVGTPNNSSFRFATITWGGPGAVRRDGD
ncbi:MAG: hypothetical protein ACE5F8_06030, partial [Woeseiaceae bacterium]